MHVASKQSFVIDFPARAFLSARHYVTKRKTRFTATILKLGKWNFICGFFVCLYTNCYSKWNFFGFSYTVRHVKARISLSIYYNAWYISSIYFSNIQNGAIQLPLYKNTTYSVYSSYSFCKHYVLTLDAPRDATWAKTKRRKIEAKSSTAALDTQWWAEKVCCATLDQIKKRSHQKMPKICSPSLVILRENHQSAVFISL